MRPLTVRLALQFVVGRLEVVATAVGSRVARLGQLNSPATTCSFEQRNEINCYKWGMLGLGAL